MIGWSLGLLIASLLSFTAQSIRSLLSFGPGPFPHQQPLLVITAGTGLLMKMELRAVLCTTYSQPSQRVA